MFFEELAEGAEAWWGLRVCVADQGSELATRPDPALGLGCAELLDNNGMVQQCQQYCQPTATSNKKLLVT